MKAHGIFLIPVNRDLNRVRINSEKMVRELIFYFKEILRNFQGIFSNWNLKSGSTAIFKYIIYIANS